ncbi:LOW QUALITY PROTEIN: hypothetical protein HID58_094426, partial [Brassica napus]
MSLKRAEPTIKWRVIRRPDLKKPPRFPLTYYSVTTAHQSSFLSEASVSSCSHFRIIPIKKSVRKTKLASTPFFSSCNDLNFHHLVSQTLVSSAASSPSKRRSFGHEVRLSLLPLPHAEPSSFFTSLRLSPPLQVVTRALEIIDTDQNSAHSPSFHRKLPIPNEEENSFGLDRSSTSVEPPWPEMVQMSTIERKANSVDLPISLRIIKRKLRMEEGVVMKQVGESAVKRASSMVFMIRELQSFTLHMRELLLFEDLQGILLRVRRDACVVRVAVPAVFSATPTLMVSVMILLANFTESEKMEALDHDTMKQISRGGTSRSGRVDGLLQDGAFLPTGLSQQPDNVLLLANYAQAEKYFKRAAKAEPADAEALSKYATFLWRQGTIYGEQRKRSWKQSLLIQRTHFTLPTTHISFGTPVVTRRVSLSTLHHNRTQPKTKKKRVITIVQVYS